MKLKKRAKVVFFIAVCLIFALGLAAFTACNGSDDPPAGETVLERIEVTKKPTKTEYVEGESFSRAGMVVTAYYSDNTNQSVLGYAVDKSGPLTTADTKVTVTYKEKATSFDIVVTAKQEVFDLEIKTADTYTYKIEAEDCTLASEILGVPKENYIETHSETKNNPTTSGGKSLGLLNFTGNQISLKIKSEVEAEISIDMCMAFNPSLDFDANVKTEWNGVKIDTGFTVKLSSGAQYVWFDWGIYTLDGLSLRKGMNELTLTILDLSANYDYFKINVNPVKSALTGIAITTPPTKTVYSEGENFNPAGMVVTASYENAATTPVNDYTVDKTVLVPSDTEVTVTHKGFTATTPVTVNPRTAALSEIVVTTPPIKTSYIAGDYFRTVGMEVTAVYSDSTTEKITGYTVNKTGALAVSDTSVTVSYEGKSTNVGITVAENTITPHVNVANGNTATHRVEAENAYLYKNNDSDGWRVEEHSASSGNPTTGGGKSIGYLNSTTTGIKVLINSETEAKFSADLRIAYKPELYFDNKIATYLNGSRLTTGFHVTQTNGTYDWFDWKIFTIDDLTLKQGLNILEFITLGDISVSYDYFDININPVKSIAVTTPPTKTDYNVGDTFDPAGMVVSATYADGTTSVVNDYTVDTTTQLADGVTEITVSYKGLTTKVGITVTETAELDRIEVTTQPTKTTYYGGEAFDPAGMVIKAFYDDGTSIPINDYTADKTVLDIGDEKVTFTYNGKSASVDITVLTHMEFADGQSIGYKLELEDALFKPGTGDKTAYTVANEAGASGGKFVESLDWMSGASFTVTIDSKVESTVAIALAAANPSLSFDTNADFVWNGVKITTGMTINTGGWTNFREFTSQPLSGLVLKEGLNTLVITLKTNESANYDYIKFTVNPIESIAVTTPPTKTEYEVGDTFDPAGMVVTATYADGTTSVINDYTVDTATQLTANVTEMTVSYKGLTAKVGVTVTKLAELDRIEVTTQPTKTTYYGGEAFDPAGMVIKAFYDDGTSIEINDYTADKTTLDIDDEKVTFTYNGKSASVDITVLTHMEFAGGQSDYKLELEDALFKPGTGDKTAYTVANEAGASGGKFVESLDWMSGASFTVTIDSKVEGTVSIFLAAAHPGFNFDNNVELLWNGVKITTGMTINTGGWTNFSEFTSQPLSGLTLNEGLNTLVITLKDNASANYDYIKFIVDPVTG